MLVTEPAESCELSHLEQILLWHGFRAPQLKLASVV